jgi:hypothetical protein
MSVRVVSCLEVTAGGQLALKITEMETCETVVTHLQEGALYAPHIGPAKINKTFINTNNVDRIPASWTG